MPRPSTANLLQIAEKAGEILQIGRFVLRSGNNNSNIASQLANTYRMPSFGEESALGRQKFFQGFHKEYLYES
jgi:hypothetical protein